MYWIEFLSDGKWQDVTNGYNTWVILQLPTKELAEEQIKVLMDYDTWPDDRSHYRICPKQ